MDSHLKDAWVDEMRSEQAKQKELEENPVYSCICCNAGFNYGFKIWGDHFCNTCGKDETTLYEYYGKEIDLNDNAELQTLINFIEHKKPLIP